MSTTMWSESTEPRNYREAINHPLYGKKWELAIREEYESLMKNGAWGLVEAPPGRNIVTCKWVFKAKRDAEGRIVRFKARLVARGFTQAYGIDYLETFAPVAKLTTYRVIFALAALEQWEIHGMDVITAFLLRKLDEEIFMAQPEGFERQGEKSKMVCRVLRSLYGLKQASRVWNIQLHEFLIKIGFKRSNADTCLYVNVELSIIIAIWVDDILIAGKSAVNIAKVKGQLAGAFRMKDLGQLAHFLGMRVTRTSDGGISIDQSMYVKDILTRFGMEDSKAVSTPLATGTKLIRTTEETSSGDKSARDDVQPLYRSIVGSLMYAMLCTRPDIAYAVQQLSQFASDPSTIHLQAAKRVLRTYKEAKILISRINGTKGSRRPFKAIPMRIGHPTKTESRYRDTYSLLQDHQYPGKPRNSQQLRFRQPKRNMQPLHKPPRKPSGSKISSKTLGCRDMHQKQSTSITRERLRLRRTQFIMQGQSISMYNSNSCATISKGTRSSSNIVLRTTCLRIL
jgi:hypothetical protein